MNNHFRKRPAGGRLTPEEADRQGRITNLALKVLGSANAIAFLNTQDDALGGQPLQIALKSVEGFAAVELALTARAAG